MKDREMIVRVREVRQLREQRAQETVMRRQAAANKAAMRVQEARQATAVHLEQTAADERAAFASLVGQCMTAIGLRRIQGRFEKAAQETTRLREGEKIATAAENERKAELSKARDDHHLHLKAVAKLDGLLELMAARTVRRRLAIAELSEEEDFGPLHPFEAR